MNVQCMFVPTAGVVEESDELCMRNPLRFVLSGSLLHIILVHVFSN